MTLTFGKHKGKAIEDVPIDYVRWLSTTEIRSAALKKAVQARLDGEPTDAQRIERLQWQVATLSKEVLRLRSLLPPNS